MILTVYNDICLVCEADKDKMISCLRASRVGFYVIPILQGLYYVLRYEQGYASKTM